MTVETAAGFNANLSAAVGRSGSAPPIASRILATRCTARSSRSPAEVAGLEPALRGELAGEHALVERATNDDADTVFGGDGKELGLRLLLEDVVDHLHAVEPAGAHEVDQRVLIVLGRRNADAAQLAVPAKPVEDVQRGGRAVPRAGPRVELHEIQAIRFEVPQAELDLLAEVILRVTVVDPVVRTGGPASGPFRRDLGRDIDPLALSLTQGAGDDALASPVAVRLGGVEEIAAEVNRPVQGPHGLLVVLRAPVRSEGPGAESDLRDVPAEAAESTILHNGLRRGRRSQTNRFTFAASAAPR